MLGGAAGVSLCGIVLEWRIAAHGDSLANPVDQRSPAGGLQRGLLDAGRAVRAGAGGRLAPARTTPRRRRGGQNKAHVPAARDELQHAHRRDLQLHGVRPARRPHRPPRRRLGHRLFRGRRPAPLRGPPAGLRLAGGRADPPLSDQEPQRHRPHPQGHAGRGGAGELPSLRARAVGPLLGVRAQRQPGELPAAPARELPAGRRDRQRARVLLADAGAGQVARRRSQRARAHAHAARTDAAHRAPRPIQFHAVQRPGAVGPLLHATCSSSSASTRSRTPTWPTRT